MGASKLFVFEADRDVGGEFVADDRAAFVRLVELGDPFACVLALLDRCTLTQLHALKLHHLLEAQKRMAKRVGAAAHAKVVAEVAAEAGRAGVTVVPPAAGDDVWDEADLIVPNDQVGPSVPAGETFDLFGGDDVDPDEPTPLAESDPA